MKTVEFVRWERENFVRDEANIATKCVQVLQGFRLLKHNVHRSLFHPVFYLKRELKNLFTWFLWKHVGFFSFLILCHSNLFNYCLRTCFYQAGSKHSGVYRVWLKHCLSCMKLYGSWWKVFWALLELLKRLGFWNSFKTKNCWRGVWYKNVGKQTILKLQKLYWRREKILFSSTDPRHLFIRLSHVIISSRQSTSNFHLFDDNE